MIRSILVLFGALLLSTPAVADVSRANADRLHREILKTLKKRSWADAGMRKSVADVLIREFRKHPRFFTRAEVDHYLARFYLAIPPDREVLQLWKRLRAPREVSQFARWCEWYPEHGAAARKQLHALSDHASKEMGKIFPAFRRNRALERSVLLYLKNVEGIEAKDVIQGFRLWSLRWLDRRLADGQYMTLLRNGGGDGSMKEHKLRITGYMHKLAEVPPDAQDRLHLPRISLFAYETEILEGRERERAELRVGSLVVSNYFMRIVLKITR